MQLALTLAALLAASPALADTCQRYGAIVTLSGAFSPGVLATVIGHDDPRGNAGRTADLLILDRPLCVDSNTMSAGVPAAANVQLLCPALAAESGAAIMLTGRLIGAHTGNGHTPVLLGCTL